MAARLLLLASVLFNAAWLWSILSANPLSSEDLHAHIAIIERLSGMWWQGKIVFYDPAWFTGWPAFQFYGFLVHWLMAIFGTLFTALSNEPYRFAVYLSLVAGISTLPISLYYAATPFAKEILGGEKTFEKYSWLLAIISGSFTLWFLSLDADFYGLGIQAVVTIGLYPQLFGWHLLLVYVGQLARFVRSEDGQMDFQFAIIIFLLIVTHTLSAFYALSIGFLAFAWFRGRRRSLCFVHLVGLGLSSFWLLPFIRYAPVFATSDPYPPLGDLLGFLFRYPLQYVSAWFFEGWFLSGSPINPIYLVLPFLVLQILLSHRLQKSGLFISFLVFVLITALVFSSEYLAASLPLGVHYYRLKALMVLVLVVLFSVVPFSILAEGYEKTKQALFARRFAAVSWAFIFCFCFVATYRLMPDEYMIFRSSWRNSKMANLHAVYGYLQGNPDVGRVYFEHLNDYALYPKRSAQYLPSRLYDETSLETVNGLFMESSLMQRMVALSADRLGANTYHGYFVFREGNTLTEEIALEQLREFGVTHVVSGVGAFFKNLEKFSTETAVSVNAHRISKIAEEKPPLVSLPKKLLVAYIDQVGNLPFSHIEYYFYSRAELALHYDLIELHSLKTVPKGVRLILLNEKNPEPRVGRKSKTPIVSFSYPGQEPLLHSRAKYPIHRETDEYHAVRDFFTKSIKLSKHLEKISSMLPSDAGHLAPNPELIWEDGMQSFVLKNITPGQMLRINYSYFPYWSSDDGVVYRGSGERIFFLPFKEEARLVFRPFSATATRLGWALSLLSIIVLFVHRKKVLRDLLSGQVKKA